MTCEVCAAHRRQGAPAGSDGGRLDGRLGSAPRARHGGRVRGEEREGETHLDLFYSYNSFIITY